MRRTRSRTLVRWSIAHKLTFASVSMILLAILAGGVGLWHVITIGQAINEAHEKEQQLARSLELLTAGHGLVAAMDHMLVTQEPLMASTEVVPALGMFMFRMEALQKAGGETGALGIVEEIETVYAELHEMASETNSLARQERWTEVGVALEQEIRPANKRLGLLIEQLVGQADQDVEAMAAYTQMVIRQALLQQAVLVVLTTAIALGWRHFVFRGLSLSIGELRQGVARISSGDLEYKLAVRTGDEIEELGNEFNKMADELADLISNLEQRVADRTRNLQTAAEVARATTSVLDPDELLRQTVDLVRERFDLYYVGLFLLDAERRFAVLRAGTGDAGQRMLAQGHRLEAGGDSMVGQCTAKAEACIALDVGEEAVRFDNLLLPETRSEMALPLRSRGQVIGAMTVQSVEEAAFDEADIAVMQTMADQVAVAIDNARLFTESQAALGAERRAYGELSRQAWSELLRTRTNWGYRYAHRSVTPVEGDWRPEMRQAGRTGQSVQSPGRAEGGDGAGGPTLAIPIQVRGQVVGVLGFRKGESSEVWTAEEVALLETLVAQLGGALESARLYQDTQRHAAREQVSSHIVDRMRRAVDMETLMQTAIREMASALGASAAFVQFGVGVERPVDEGGDGRTKTRPERAG